MAELNWEPIQSMQQHDAPIPLILVHMDGGTLFAVIAFITTEAPTGNDTEDSVTATSIPTGRHPCAGTPLRVEAKTTEAEVLREAVEEVLTPLDAIMGPEHVEVYDPQTTAADAGPWNDLWFQVILKASDSQPRHTLLCLAEHLKEGKLGMDSLLDMNGAISGYVRQRQDATVVELHLHNPHGQEPFLFASGQAGGYARPALVRALQAAADQILSEAAFR